MDLHLNLYCNYEIKSIFLNYQIDKCIFYTLLGYISLLTTLLGGIIYYVYYIKNIKGQIGYSINMNISSINSILWIIINLYATFNPILWILIRMILNYFDLITFPPQYEITYSILHSTSWSILLLLQYFESEKRILKLSIFIKSFYFIYLIILLSHAASMDYYSYLTFSAHLSLLVSNFLVCLLSFTSRESNNNTYTELDTKSYNFDTLFFSPEDTASYISKLFLGWYEFGYLKLCESDGVDINANNFISLLKNSSILLITLIYSIIVGYSSIFFAAFSLMNKRFYLAFFYKISCDLFDIWTLWIVKEIFVEFVSIIFFINLLLFSVSTKYGIGWVCSLFATLLLRALFQLQYEHRIVRTSLSFTSAIFSNIYSKLLTSNSSNSRFHDLSSLDLKLNPLFELFTFIPVSLLVIWLFTINASYGCLVLIPGLLLKHLVDERLISATKDYEAVSSKRKVLFEKITNDYKNVQLFAMEDHFETSINILRSKELKKLWHVQVLFTFQTFIWPFIILLSIWFSLIEIYETMEIYTAFTVLLLYITLGKFSLQFLHSCLFITELFESISLADNLLSLNSLERFGNIESDYRGSVSINMDMANFQNIHCEIILKDLSLIINFGQKVAIVGDEKNVKDFFDAVIGEYDLHSGISHVRGRIALASNNSWLLPGSIKENILFMNGFNEKWYEDVCLLLQKDISSLPDGDKTLVSNLSPELKQKVLFARAIYSDADIYIFDDPLNLLKSYEIEAFYEACFHEFLNSKTVLIFTSYITIHSHCDSLLSLDYFQSTKITNKYISTCSRCFDPIEFDFKTNNIEVDTESYSGSYDSSAPPPPPDADADIFTPPPPLDFLPDRSFTSLPLHSVSGFSTTNPEIIIQKPNSISISIKSGLELNPPRSLSISPKRSLLTASLKSMPNVKKLNSLSSFNKPLISSLIIKKPIFESLTIPAIPDFEYSINNTVLGLNWRFPLKSDLYDTVSSGQIGNQSSLNDLESNFLSIDNEDFRGFSITLSETIQFMIYLIMLAISACSFLGSPILLSAYFTDRLSYIIFGLHCIGFGLASIIFYTFTSLLVCSSTFKTAVTIHEKFVKMVFNRIIIVKNAELFKHLHFIDRIFPFSIQNLYHGCAMVLFTAASIFYISPFMISLLIPFTWHYGRYFGRNVGLNFILSNLYFYVIDRFQSHLKESAEALKVIRAYGQNQIAFFEAKFRFNLTQLLRIKYSIGSLHNFISFQINLISVFGSFFLALYCITNRPKNTFDSSLYCLALIFCIYFSWIVNYFNDALKFQGECADSLSYFYHQEESQKNIILPNHIPPSYWPRHGAIVFKNVNALKILEHLPLKNVSFSIQADEKVGLLQIGSSKNNSTILLALTRVIDYTGLINLDGIDISLVPFKNLRTRIGSIVSCPAIFPGTIKFNIDPAGKFSENNLWDCLKLVNLFDVVKELPLGLNTEDFNLDYDEMQLLCLTREILRSPRVLIIDNVFEKLSTITATTFHSVINETFKGTTVIIISINYDHFVHCSRVLSLQNGILAEMEKNN